MQNLRLPSGRRAAILALVALTATVPNASAWLAAEPAAVAVEPTGPAAPAWTAWEGPIPVPLAPAAPGAVTIAFADVEHGEPQPRRYAFALPAAPASEDGNQTYRYQVLTPIEADGSGWTVVVTMAARPG